MVSKKASESASGDAKATASKAASAGKKAAANTRGAAKSATTKASATKASTAKEPTAKAPAKKSAASTGTAAKKPAAAKVSTAKAAATKVATAEAAATKTATAEKSATDKTVAPENKPGGSAKKTPATSTSKKAGASAKKDVADKKSASPAKKVAADRKGASPAKKTAAEKKSTAPAKKAETVAKKADAAPSAKVGSAAQDIAAEIKVAAAEAKEASEFASLPGVLIAAAECAPLVKVGGLADVVGSLPKYLKKLGVDARVIMPFHRQVKERYGSEVEHMADFQASLGWRSQYVGLERLEIDGVVYYFIDNEFYFGGPIYCGGEFEGEQYAFFTRAVMDSIPLLDYEVGILHCNDWHTAMMPLLVRTQYQGGMQSGLKTLLTIHNLHFQGQFSHEFDRDLLGVDDSLATPQFVEHYGCDNMLKAGIVFADKVNTVSPTYAREICEPYLGESLDGVLRSRGDDLQGILNAIDYDEWNPQTDPNLPAHFSKDDLEGKRAVKEALLGELGLQAMPKDDEVPLIGMVGRLTPQKGIDLVQRVLDDIMRENVRVIVLGSGYREFEDFLRDAENRYKGRLCSFIGYAGELSHRIYAGSDLFLMPSLFEPCGISQMISMRYGTLPVVRETGGLRDTVVPYNQFTGEGNGFSFANYDAYEMLNAIQRGIAAWRDVPVRKQLMRQAMETDFSFDRCAHSYAELYRQL